MTSRVPERAATATIMPTTPVMLWVADIAARFVQTPRIAPPASPKGRPRVPIRAGAILTDMSDVKIFIAIITVFTVLVISAFIPRGYPQKSSIFPRSCHA